MEMNFEMDHFAALDAIPTFVGRCRYIQNLIDSEFQFELEDQPEAWIQRLVIMEYAIPMVVVNYIDQMFGRKIICTEASFINGYSVYIVDTLGMLLNGIQDIEFLNRNQIENNIIRTIHILKDI